MSLVEKTNYYRASFQPRRNSLWAPSSSHRTQTTFNNVESRLGFLLPCYAQMCHEWRIALYFLSSRSSSHTTETCSRIRAAIKQCVAQKNVHAKLQKGRIVYSRLCFEKSTLSVPPVYSLVIITDYTILKEYISRMNPLITNRIHIFLAIRLPPLKQKLQLAVGLVNFQWTIRRRSNVESFH